jgi:hypothetical protein
MKEKKGKKGKEGKMEKGRCSQIKASHCTNLPLSPRRVILCRETKNETSQNSSIAKVTESGGEVYTMPPTLVP